MLLEGSEPRVELAGNERRKVEAPPERVASAPYAALAAMLSRVTGVWRQSSEGRNSSSVELTKFRALRDQFCRHDRSDALDAAQANGILRKVTANLAISCMPVPPRCAVSATVCPGTHVNVTSDGSAWLIIVILQVFRFRSQAVGG